MKGLNCANISDRSKLATMFIHAIIYYDDYLIIIMNGGKGLVTAENIPLKSIENSLIIDIPGTFSGSSVSQPAPPNIDSFRQKTVDIYLLIDSIWHSVHKSCASDFIGCATN